MHLEKLQVMVWMLTQGCTRQDEKKATCSSFRSHGEKTCQPVCWTQVNNSMRALIGTNIKRELFKLLVLCGDTFFPLNNRLMGFVIMSLFVMEPVSMTPPPVFWFPPLRICDVVTTCVSPPQGSLLDFREWHAVKNMFGNLQDVPLFLPSYSITSAALT